MFDWPHAPLHRFHQEGFYFITSGTYGKEHHYRAATRLDRLQARAFELMRQHDIQLQAWSFLSNHYHLVVRVEGDANRVRTMLGELHSSEAIACNRDDATPGRKVWFQFRDTLLTFERSWLARLRYTHENAVHHGLVADARRYRWCSAAWFESNARPSFVKVVRSFKIDRLNLPDDYDAHLAE